jgi:hypothetical protein
MNSSKIKTWEGGKKESVFLRLRTLGIDPKEQIKGEAEGLIKAPKLRSHRFQDARMRLKQTIEIEGTVAAAKASPPFSTSNTGIHGDNTGSKSSLVTISNMLLKMTTNSLPGDTSKPSPGAQQKQIPSISYILSWGKAAGAVLVRFGGLENEIDHKELALAVEVMKAALNDCNLHEVKRESLSPPTQELATRQATRQELATPSVQYILQHWASTVLF